MTVVLGLLAGVGLALLSIASTRYNCARLRPHPVDALELERLAWAAYLSLAALIYIGFALREAGDGWMGVELLGLVGYTALAVIGARRPVVLALGWGMHAGWDIIIHAGVPGEFVPQWYRWACLSFDVVAAAYLVSRASGRSR
ncbi:MAG: hypothetical protein H6713_38300 [Myxococcales bacterium]|nr:hypothetical protein [Myxococcales bacterium]MCB9755819.1 hypothetical protein [Myxococcales bacterium]